MSEPAAQAIGAHELSEFDTTALDVAKCHRLELVVGLTEYDQGLSHRFETWPEIVRVKMQQYLDTWLQAKQGIEIRAVTTGVRLRSCVLVVHYDQK